ncbi:MAG: YitT family protein [Lachnospiraceae bacterium]|nr:YitT family protein [Lachnospiraceae bacterium]
MVKSIVERINFKDLLIIIAGTFLMALAINLVFDPIGLDTGGVTGLAIVIKYATAGLITGGVPVWLSNIFFNVPLFIVAIKNKGFRYMIKTGFSTLMLTLWLYLIPITSVIEEKLLAVVFGGVLSGIGIGLVFSTMATTGGSDLFSALLHDKWRHLSIPRILSVTDGIIVFLGIFIFGLENVIYSIIVVYLVAKISDGILDGLKFAKMVYIISDKAEDISAEILIAIDRGVTGIKVKGMYSGEDKKMLFCVVGKKQVVELTDIVTRLDKRAFMVVADAREVMGEGFAEVKNDN